MKYNKFKIYLLLCIVIFFIMTFVVLFYSFGYKYNTKQGKIIQTGAIILKTFPKEANIYMDGNLVKKNSGLSNLFSDDIKIEGLEPRQFEISADLDGYSTWKKNIVIESKRVMEFKNIVLIKNEPKKNIISEKVESMGENNFWISNDKNRIAYRKIYDGKDTLFIYDLANKTEKILGSFERIFPIKNSDNITIHNIIWSENDSKIFLSIAKDKKIYSAIIYANNDPKIYKISDNMENIKNGWNFQLDDSMFYLKGNNLFKNDLLNEKAASSKIVEGISGFLVEGNTLFYIKTDSSYVFKKDLATNSSETILFKLPDDFESKDASSIKRSANGYIILTGQNKLYLTDSSLETINISSNATDANFFANSSRIIYNNTNEIWIYYIDEKNNQPQKQRGTNELLTRYSSNIDDIYLYSDDEHIFYKEGYVFKFAELDDRGKRNIFDVASVRTNDIAYLSNDDSIIYLENGNLIRSFLDNEQN